MGRRMREGGFGGSVTLWPECGRERGAITWTIENGGGNGRGNATLLCHEGGRCARRPSPLVTKETKERRLEQEDRTDGCGAA